MATIAVTVTNTADGLKVSATENPQIVEQEDTVTWDFNSGPDDLLVVFKKVELPDNSGALLINEKGPFSRPLSRSGNKISGTIAQQAPRGLYLYDIRDGNNQRLQWVNSISKTKNFGGLDVPKPPPR